MCVCVCVCVCMRETVWSTSYDLVSDITNVSVTCHSLGPTIAAAPVFHVARYVNDVVNQDLNLD